MVDAYVPTNFNASSMAKLGETLRGTFDTYKRDRRMVEEQWLKNLRQFRGIYDPAIKIPDDQSTAYPKITRNKVIGTVARLMEMLFPRTDKNYSVQASPLPNLPESDVQSVLDQLTQGQPAVQLTDDVIERAIKALADEKAKNLDRVITDQLTELDYVTLAKRVIFSGVLYGIGILEGPMVLEDDSRTWTRDPVSGRYKATTIKKKKPYFENASVWSFYTDLSAKSLDALATDGEFKRMVMSRTQLSKLADRPDFIGAVIKAYLASHKQGNFKEEWWETELRTEKSDKANVTDIGGRKFEVVSFWGRVTGQQLKDCGVAVPDNRLADEVEANVWMVDKVIIKATLNPYDERIRGYHYFIYEEDDINLLGVGLPVIMRDSQLAICEAARMTLDNGSVVCGPMLEINQSALMPGQDLDVYARKIWVREDSGMDAQTPAVREINVDAHITELIKIIELFQGFADTETALPPPALGDVSGQGGEAMRTSGNLSMLLGAAALPIRDTVRNFDKFTVSFVSSLCYWNMEFNATDSIRGDFNVVARGSTSLIAKEVRATSLDQFWSTLDPDDKIYLSRKKVLLERMRVRDLPDDLLEDDTVVQNKLNEQAKNAQASAQQAAVLAAMQVREAAATAFKDLMLGLKAQAGANADTFNSLVGGILNVRAAQQPPAGGGGASTGASRPSARSGVKGAVAAA